MAGIDDAAASLRPPTEPSGALQHESETTLDDGISTDQVELASLTPTGSDFSGSAAFDREAACSALPTAKARDAQATTPGIVFPSDDEVIRCTFPRRDSGQRPIQTLR